MVISQPFTENVQQLTLTTDYALTPAIHW